MTAPNTDLLPCPLCNEQPGSKVGPPALVRCVTDGCEGKSRGTETPTQWNARIAATLADEPEGYLVIAMDDDGRETWRGYCRTSSQAHKTAAGRRGEDCLVEPLFARTAATQEAEIARLPEHCTPEIACILEECDAPEKQTPQALAHLVQMYEPVWQKLRAALTTQEKP